MSEHDESQPPLSMEEEALDGLLEAAYEPDSDRPGLRAGPIELDPDRYRDFEVIGVGGMGIVYLALDTELNRPVAVKVVRPPTGSRRSKDDTPMPFEIQPPQGADHSRSYKELTDRFLQEAWLTGALEHPGIVPIYELGATPRGVPYYTMRYVKGVRTMKSELAKSASLEERMDLLDPFMQVCDAISYAHSRGVIHRDLKPGNVGLGEFGEVVVLDWGLAKMRDEPDAVDSLWQDRIRDFRQAQDMETVAGVLGTPGYMSPEAALGDLDRVDERSDVYSLSAMLYQILTGALPFRTSSFVELVQKLRETTPVPPARVDPAVPHDLSEICMRGLLMEKADRQAGAGALADAIREHQRDSRERSEIRSLMQQAEAACDAAQQIEGDARLRQLDRVRALCDRVLDQKRTHERAKRLLEKSDRIRQITLNEREQAIQEEAEAERDASVAMERSQQRRILKQVGLAAMLIFALGAGIAAWVFDTTATEARGHEQAAFNILADLGIARDELGSAKTRIEEERKARAQEQQELATAKTDLTGARADARAALEDRDRAVADLAAERAKRNTAASPSDAGLAEARQAAEKLRTRLANERKETSRLLAALGAEEKARRMAEERAAGQDAERKKLTEALKVEVELRQDAESVANAAKADEQAYRGALIAVRGVSQLGSRKAPHRLLLELLERHKPDPKTGKKGSQAVRTALVRALGQTLGDDSVPKILGRLLSEYSDDAVTRSEVVSALAGFRGGQEMLRKHLKSLRKNATGPEVLEEARTVVRALGRPSMNSRDESFAALMAELAWETRRASHPWKPIHEGLKPDVLAALREITRLPFQREETWLTWHAHVGERWRANTLGKRDTKGRKKAYARQTVASARWRFMHYHPFTDGKGGTYWIQVGPGSGGGGEYVHRPDKTHGYLPADHPSGPRGESVPYPPAMDARLSVKALAVHEEYPRQPGESDADQAERALGDVVKLGLKTLSDALGPLASSSFGEQVKLAGRPAIRHRAQESEDGGVGRTWESYYLEHNALIYIVTLVHGPKVSKSTRSDMKYFLKAFDLMDP